MNAINLSARIWNNNINPSSRSRAIFLSLILSVVLLAACAKGNGISLAPYEDKDAWPGHFTLCHGFGCSHRSRVQLSEKQWSKVAAVFARPAATPAKERAQITKAVAVLEIESTKAARLAPDHGQAHTFEKDQAQMDCLDETINTSHYIEFLADAGFLKYHDPALPLHRGFFVDGMWPHNSAAVKEKNTGAVYAIDSYYFDSGKPPAIVPIDTWLDEWRPAGLKPEKS